MPAHPIHALTSEAIRDEAARRLTRGAGVTLGIYRDVMHRGAFDPAAHGLAPRTIAAWREAFSFELPTVLRQVEEDTHVGPTSKAVLRLADGMEIESVRIPMGRDRFTLCISSQVGCKMGCTFCETARMGLIRHLASHEIVAQLLVARHVLGWSFKNVVFMGMGEALDNVDNVARALEVMNDPVGLQIPQENITVCTVGHAEGIERLRALGLRRLNLSVSLNAADDFLRAQLMPVSRRTPLRELKEALGRYRPRRNFALGVNYCLMPGLNDSREDAAKVADFCDGLGRALVNVIPYNPGNAPLARAPSDAEVDAFIGYLRDGGLAVRRRVTKGRSVMAACGQLGNVELRERRRLSPSPGRDASASADSGPGSESHGSRSAPGSGSPRSVGS